MLSKLQRNQKGFTLIELMIVVVIIGILAALAIPRFMGATKKAKTTEAQAVLKQIYVLERAYFQEHDAYTSNKASLGWEDPGGRYTYAWTAADSSSFTVTATADIDGDGANDVWTIDESSPAPDHTTVD